MHIDNIIQIVGSVHGYPWRDIQVNMRPSPLGPGFGPSSPSKDPNKFCARAIIVTLSPGFTER